MFDAVVFVDYRHKPIDAVAPAVSNIAAVLGENLPDTKAAAKALKKTPTLIILDNLEALTPESLHALLHAAVSWSEAGGSRVLCTTRRPTFDLPQYQVEGTVIHRRIVLDGIGNRYAPDDALEWLAVLMKLPPVPKVPMPKRETLIPLFEQVKFHPLSIRVLAQQLKSRRPTEIGERLEQLLALTTSSGAADPQDDTPASLLASVQLSLDQLDTAARELLPRLGVFQGGALETELRVVTELDAPESDAWPAVRRQLEGAALIEAEAIPGAVSAFLRFHPTLAPMIWAQLNTDERARLTEAHRLRYYLLSGFLYVEDNRNPQVVRAIAWAELPNLLRGVHAALEAGDPNAVDFADNVNRFLDMFGLRAEARNLAASAEASSGNAGSPAWLLAQTNRGERLRNTGQISEATELFQSVLKQLDETPTLRRAITFTHLGRCYEAAGLFDQAENHHRAGLAICDRLEQIDSVRRMRAAVLFDLGDVLRRQGKFSDARETYEKGLELARELQDLRGQGVAMGQLGTLALLEHSDGWFAEASRRYYAALEFFEQLREPASQSVAHHQLGMLFHEARLWDNAENHYRQAARIKDELGDLVGACRTWNQLAVLSVAAGKPEAAEEWFRKAIDGGRQLNDLFGLAPRLSNLALLLFTNPSRLVEARQLAEEALKIKLSLDADGSEVWTTYSVLAKIADKEATLLTDIRVSAERREQARYYRRMARNAKRNFPGTRYELRQHAPLIRATILAVLDVTHRPSLDEALPAVQQHGWTNLVTVIERILDGERDADSLCENLNMQDSMIVETILYGLTDPSSVADLLPES